MLFALKTIGEAGRAIQYVRTLIVSNRSDGGVRMCVRSSSIRTKQRGADFDSIALGEGEGLLLHPRPLMNQSSRDLMQLMNGSKKRCTMRMFSLEPLAFDRVRSWHDAERRRIGNGIKRLSRLANLLGFSLDQVRERGNASPFPNPPVLRSPRTRPTLDVSHRTAEDSPSHSLFSAFVPVCHHHHHQ